MTWHISEVTTFTLALLLSREKLLMVICLTLYGLHVVLVYMMSRAVFHVPGWNIVLDISVCYQLTFEL